LDFIIRYRFYNKNVNLITSVNDQNPHNYFINVDYLNMLLVLLFVNFMMPATTVIIDSVIVDFFFFVGCGWKAEFRM
jgi:hypothetical protein